MDYTEGSVRLTRGDMRYIRFGNGEKIFVMIAGVTVTGIAGLGGAICEAYSPYFGGDTTVFTFERLDAVPEGYTIHDMAADIAEAMDHFGLRDADVMGASQGGMIALALALDRPELVHSLVLASSSAYVDETGRETMRRWIEMADRNDGRGIYRDFFAKAYARPDMNLLALLEDTATEEQCRRFGVLISAILSYDDRSELSKVKCPVLVIAAGSDTLLGSAVQTGTAELLHCECCYCPGYAHAAYDEEPDYKEKLRAFFEKNRA